MRVCSLNINILFPVRWKPDQLPIFNIRKVVKIFGVDLLLGTFCILYFIYTQFFFEAGC